MRNKLLYFFFFSVFALAASDLQAAPSLQRENFLTGLKFPWDLAFTPDGAALFTERCGGLSVRRNDGTIARLFGGNGYSLVAKDFFCEGQSGMLGVAVDPDFSRNRYVYVMMASIRSGVKSNHVVRLIVDDGYAKASERKDIVQDIPYKQRAHQWGAAGAHSGGRLRFGPDGYLYVTSGDNHNGALPQDLRLLGGKVIRVDRDGSAAPNHPPAGADKRIFTYGHRNVQGLTFHPVTGQPYVSEHGPKHSDEVTALVDGGNAGWDPAPEAGVNCANDYCGYISNKPDGTPTPMTDREKFPGALPPLLQTALSQGMGPCTFLTGEQWGEWNGALLVSLMAGQRVDVLRLDEKGEIADRREASLPPARMRSLVQHPDGDLYVVTDGGEIWKIRPGT